MEVKVRLYATLSQYNPEGQGNNPFSAEIAAGATVEELLLQLGLEKGEVKQVFIRHKARPFNHKLTDGDQVAIFPPVAGG